jgi:di/tripeptidase
VTTDPTTALGQRMRAEREKMDSSLDQAWTSLNGAIEQLGQAKAAAVALEDSYAHEEIESVSDWVDVAVKAMEGMSYWAVPA